MSLRAILAAVLTFVAVGFAGTVTTAQAAPYPPTTCATLSVSTTTPDVGAAITVTGENFTPGATVHLVLRPTNDGAGSDFDLKTTRADSDGSFVTQVVMPDATTNKGAHVLLATSGAPNLAGCPADPLQALDLQGPDGNNGGNGTPGSTAFTGVNVVILIIVAAALVGAGAMLNGRSRSRHPRVRR